jgi:hypothetical protein
VAGQDGRRSQCLEAVSVSHLVDEYGAYLADTSIPLSLFLSFVCSALSLKNNWAGF